MRRKELEVMDPKAIELFLKKGKSVNVAFFDENAPYVVPLSYGYYEEDGNKFLVFHGAKEGHKLDLAKLYPNVGFDIIAMDESHQDENGECTVYYASLIGTGKVEMVEDREEKIKCLNILLSHQGARPYPFERMIDYVAVGRIRVLSLTAKAKKPALEKILAEAN